MFESYIRGVFYYNYSSCHQLHTVALSFLPYAAGKQQLEGEMPKIRHFRISNRSQRDDLICGRQIWKKTRGKFTCHRVFLYIWTSIGSHGWDRDFAEQNRCTPAGNSADKSGGHHATTVATEMERSGIEVPRYCRFQKTRYNVPGLFVVCAPWARSNG